MSRPVHAQVAGSKAVSTGPATSVLPAEGGLLASRIVLPPATGGTWVRQKLLVKPVETAEAPRIDGIIDDAAWRGAAHAVGFFRETGSTPVAEQTEAWVLCDKKNLYVAFHCLDSRADLIRASETQRGGTLDQDDHVGIDIDSQNSQRSVSTFRVSALGTQWEHLEGGTADNITWTGDWKAAAHRTPDGWTCEMAIPFRLLHYPKNTNRFGIFLFRQVGRETSRECWPGLPPGGDQDEARFLADLSGIAPPVILPRPVFLPYALASAGQNTVSHARQGIDIKYPLTTTLTGVATLFPDFETVEQAVTDISFSYNEKFLPDNRPFFAEGGEYLPYRDLFYSRRLGQIDGGLKIAGKQDSLSLGLLGVTSGWDRNADPSRRQQAYVLSAIKDIGAFDQLVFDFVDDQQNGLPTNQVAKMEAHWAGLWHSGYHPNAFLTYSPSWEGGKQKGVKEFAHFGTGASRGHPNTGINYEILPDDYISDLGFNPELNHKGYEWWLEQYNDFDRGPVDTYWAGVNVSGYNHIRPDTFFHKAVSPEAFVGFRSGWGVDLAHSESERDSFRDHTTDYDLAWNRRTLFQRGSAHVTTGRQADQAYRFIGVNQGILVARPLSLQVGQSWVRIGPGRQAQTILTGTYRLTAARTVGTRLVRQTGTPDPASTDPVPNGTNLYFSYGQHVRSGYDLFVLVGDPNSLETHGTVTVKVVQPL